MPRSKLELAFETLWITLAGPQLEPEYRFAPTRRWRFDFAHPDTKIAVELDGGTWNGGRHVRGDGYARDCEKLNAASADGWRVFRLTSDMLDNDPYGHLMPIITAIDNATENIQDEDNGLMEVIGFA